MLINFQVLSNEQLDYPFFSFQKSRVLKNTEKFLVNMKESLFLVRKYPALWSIRNVRGVHIGYKNGTVTSNKLMRSDELFFFQI